MSTPYIVVEDVAARLHCSVRSVHELARLCRVPHRRLPGTRRLLFREIELELWENGCDLEIEQLPRGGRIVRPVSNGGGQR